MLSRGSSEQKGFLYALMAQPSKLLLGPHTSEMMLLDASLLSTTRAEGHWCVIPTPMRAELPAAEGMEHSSSRTPVARRDRIGHQQTLPLDGNGMRPVAARSGRPRGPGDPAVGQRPGAVANRTGGHVNRAQAANCLPLAFLVSPCHRQRPAFFL